MQWLQHLCKCITLIKQIFMKTKIIATLGPSSDSKTELIHLIQAGMDIARLNMSHGDHTTHTKLIKNIPKNQIKSPFFADFQSPIPFQKASHRISTRIPAPKSGSLKSLNIYLLYTKRRGRDLNPRYLAVYALSKRAH